MEGLILIILASTATGIPRYECDKVKILEKYYDKEILWANSIGRPYNLNIHVPTNTLFFSFSTPETYSVVDFTLAYYNMDKHQYAVIAGIKGGCAVAIDNISNDIYMGGSDGIYKFNMENKDAEFYKEKGRNIWSLFCRKNLFYISYPDQKLHMEIDDKFALIKEFEHFQIDHFFVTTTNELLFANETGLYKFDTASMNVLVINEIVLVRSIVDDNNGVVYVCTNLGIFTYIKDELKKILSNKYIYGLTFDVDNNFIISDGNSLVRLKYSKKTCEPDDASMNIMDFHW